MGSARIRAVIADDTPDIRDILRLCLELDGGFEIVGEAADGAEAVALVERVQPDVILLDLAMPVMDGLQAIPEITAKAPATRILVLSGFEGMSKEAIRRGADAYLPKGTAPSRILSSLYELCPDSAERAGPPTS